MSNTPGEDIRVAVSNLIKSKMATNLPAVPVTFEGQKVTQPVGTVWIYVTVVENDTCKAVLGRSGKYKTLGAVQIQCMAPEDRGTKELRQVTDVLTRILASKQISVPGSGSITFYNVQKRNRGKVNGWQTINVVSEYRHWHTLTNL